MRFRLELADAVIWAVEHPDELLAIVRSAPTCTDAINALLAPPLSFGEAAAHHVLDLRFRLMSIENVSRSSRLA